MASMAKVVLVPHFHHTTDRNSPQFESCLLVCQCRLSVLRRTLQLFVAPAASQRATCVSLTKAHTQRSATRVTTAPQHTPTCGLQRTPVASRQWHISYIVYIYIYCCLGRPICFCDIFFLWFSLKKQQQQQISSRK